MKNLIPVFNFNSLAYWIFKIFLMFFLFYPFPIVRNKK